MLESSDKKLKHMETKIEFLKRLDENRPIYADEDGEIRTRKHYQEYIPELQKQIDTLKEEIELKKSSLSKPKPVAKDSNGEGTTGKDKN